MKIIIKNQFLCYLNNILRLLKKRNFPNLKAQKGTTRLKDWASLAYSRYTARWWFSCGLSRSWQVLPTS